ncbi:MAG: hypothetical protein ACREDR_36610, partial [Blastocatellia bacterium]
VVDAGYRVPNFRETRNYVRSISSRYGSATASLKQTPGQPVPSPAVAMPQGSSAGLSNNY